MRIAVVLLAALAAACSTLQEDPPAPYEPTPLGNGLHLAQIQDPKSPQYDKTFASVSTTSQVVTWLDTFDETMDGKSKGTLYVQDVLSTKPYSGIGIYDPNYIPADLDALPGDVLDLTGPYQEEAKIGTAIFDQGTFLPQLSKPVASFRYEWTVPPMPPVQPATITAADIVGADSNFPKGRKWLGMLATIEDVTAASSTNDGKNRITYPFSSGGAPLDASPPAFSNELFDLKQYPCATGETCFKPGTHFKSITGIVTWFFSYHLAPRTPADLVPDGPLDAGAE